MCSNISTNRGVKSCRHGPGTIISGFLKSIKSYSSIVFRLYQRTITHTINYITNIRLISKWKFSCLITRVLLRILPWSINNISGRHSTILLLAIIDCWISRRALQRRVLYVSYPRIPHLSTTVMIIIIMKESTGLFNHLTNLVVFWQRVFRKRWRLEYFIFLKR